MSLNFDPRQPSYITFDSDIYDEGVHQLYKACTHIVDSGATELTIAMHSPGGSVSKGTALHNFLKSLPLELTTHNIGDIDSIANVVFLAGKYRYSNPNGRFMLHGVTRSFDGGARLGEADLLQQLEYVRADQERIAQTIARQTKLTVREIKRAFKNGDNILTPPEAEQKEIIHGIKDLVVPANANVLNIACRRG